MCWVGPATPASQEESGITVLVDGQESGPDGKVDIPLPLSSVISRRSSRVGLLSIKAGQERLNLVLIPALDALPVPLCFEC